MQKWDNTENYCCNNFSLDTITEYVLRDANTQEQGQGIVDTGNDVYNPRGGGGGTQVY